MEWGRQNIPQVDKLEQARKGSANEDHFAKNRWGSLHSLVQVTNQKYTRNLKRTIKTSDMALLLIELGESFATAILDMLIDCEFPLTHCCLPQTMLSLIDSPSILKE